MAGLLDVLTQLATPQVQQQSGWQQILQGLQGMSRLQDQPDLPMTHLAKLASAAPQYYAAPYASALSGYADPNQDLKRKLYESQIQQANDPFERLAKIQQLSISQQNADAITQRNLLEQQQRQQIQNILNGGQQPSALQSLSDNAPLNQRNNNPGNLKDPVTGEFKKFNTPEEGALANLADLQFKISGDSPVMKKLYGDNYTPTLKNVLAAWAPASDNNDPEKYADFVSKNTGISKDKRLALEDAATILPAMAQFEGSKAYDLPQALATLPVSPISIPQTNAMTLPNQTQPQSALANVSQESPAVSLLKQMALIDPEKYAAKYAEAKASEEKDQKKQADSVITPDNANLTGQAFLDSLNNQDVKNKAKALLEGRIPYPTINSRTPTVMKQAVEAAQQADPTFTAQTYPVRVKTQQAFTSGQEAKNINALNTALNHLGELKKAADDLHNSKYMPINWLVNKSQRQIDDEFNSRVNDYNIAKNAVATEVAKVYRGVGSLNEQEQNEWKESLSPNLGPEAQQKAIQKTAKLLTGKLDSLKDQYETVFPDSNKDFLSAKAKTVLQKVGVSSGGDTIGTGQKVIRFEDLP